jgi:hypothetical protein
MWYTINEMPPEEEKEHVIWVKATHSGFEFPCIAFYHNERWFISGRDLEINGWEFIAWYDLPPYRIVKKPIYKIEKL